MSNEANQPGPMDGLDPIEEQKTRLWALSFEPSRQVVHCQNCGAATVVSRLVANTDAVPERQESNMGGATALVDRPQKSLPCPIQHHSQAIVRPAEPAQAARDRLTVKVLSALSATLCLALVTVLVRSRPNKKA